MRRLRGKLVISGAVFADLLAMPRRTEAFIEEFLRETGIGVDWITDEVMWRVAGKLFRLTQNRRRKQRSDEPRRLLADFLIGAHAVENGFALLTLDDGIYRAAFPKLRIVKV